MLCRPNIVRHYVLRPVGVRFVSRCLVLDAVEILNLLLFVVMTTLVNIVYCLLQFFSVLPPCN